MSILSRIRSKGGDAWMEATMLCVKRGHLADADLAWIKAHRSALIREIWPEFDDWEERAAVREYCGGQSREEAEREAYGEVMARC